MKRIKVMQTVTLNGVKWLIEEKFRPTPACSMWIVVSARIDNQFKRYVVSGNSAKQLLDLCK